MTRRRCLFTASQKAEAVRMHLMDRVPVFSNRRWLDAKNEVISELMEENIRSKKAIGEPWKVAGFPMTRETKLAAEIHAERDRKLEAARMRRRGINQDQLLAVVG